MAKHKGFGQGAAKLCCQPDFPESALSELRWWVRNLSTWNGMSFLNPNAELDIIITSDASLLGWGAAYLGLTIQCRWSDGDVAAHQCAGIEGSRVNLKIIQGPVGRAVVFDHDWITWQLSQRLWKWVRHGKNVSGSDLRNMSVCHAREHDYWSA